MTTRLKLINEQFLHADEAILVQNALRPSALSELDAIRGIILLAERLIEARSEHSPIQRDRLAERRDAESDERDV